MTRDASHLPDTVRYHLPRQISAEPLWVEEGCRPRATELGCLLLEGHPQQQVADALVNTTFRVTIELSHHHCLFFIRVAGSVFIRVAGSVSSLPRICQVPHGQRRAKPPIPLTNWRRRPMYSISSGRADNTTKAITTGTFKAYSPFVAKRYIPSGRTSSF